MTYPVLNGFCEILKKGRTPYRVRPFLYDTVLIYRLFILTNRQHEILDGPQ
jgi:hypothetical protein